MRVRPKADSHLGWAYRPDSDTVSSLQRGTRKLKDYKNILGSDRPHEGGSLAEALVEARKAEDKRRFGKRRRRKVAKKVVKTASKKRTVEQPTGKLIALKTICAEMDLDPKATRVKLRRLVQKGELDHDMNSRWEFTKARAKEVRALLAE